ncbi:MAG: CARDB domain-containing protein, partial [Kiritimatiellia bacterium]
MIMHNKRTLALALFALPAIAYAAPDLYVQSIYMPGQANPGDAVAAGMEIVVRNQGDEAAATFSVGAYISTDAIITTNDTLLTGSRTTVTNLPAGGDQEVLFTSDFIIPPDLSPGAYFIGVAVDEFDQVSEAIESNNHASKPIQIN